MNLIKTAFLCVAAASVATSAVAQDGSTAYSFLNIPSSSKIYGLGGVNISLVDDNLNIVDQNPALLGQEMSDEISVNYMRYIGDSNFAGARYARKFRTHGAWSAAVQYFGYGSMKETDITGAVIGDLSAKDLTFSGMYSHDITTNLRGGINLKMVYSSYAEYSAFAIATDLGINYYDSERDLSLSAVVANLGGQVKRFDQAYERLPIDVRLGWSQSFGSLPVRFSVTAWNLTKWHLPFYKLDENSDAMTRKDSFTSNLLRHLVFGADLIASDNWYVGIGYNYKMRSDMSTYHRSFLSGFSLAGGISVKSFGVGIAFAQPHTGATTFMVNLSMNINNLIH